MGPFSFDLVWLRSRIRRPVWGWLSEDAASAKTDLPGGGSFATHNYADYYDNQPIIDTILRI